MFDEKIAAALSGIVDIQSYLVGMGKPRPSFGESLLKSAEFKAFQDKRTDLVTKANIIGTGAANDPLVHGGKPFIDAGVRQPLTLRQLLPAFPTLAGAIELPVKTSSTNAAAVQDREGTAHGESAYGFESSFVPVQTLGHWVPASNQIFEDAGQLDGFIRSELLSDLAAVVEDQLLNGDGTNSQLTGLLDNATAYSQSSPITYTWTARHTPRCDLPGTTGEVPPECHCPAPAGLAKRRGIERLAEPAPGRPALRHRADAVGSAGNREHVDCQRYVPGRRLQPSGDVV
ncbi:MAG: phage major capsid protein [Gammaproteobacteria bacterium]|nr:phage major capsid protein [Gammaproteobacteria bacterium]